MANTAKRLVYWAARAMGLFALARRANRGRLRILAYHGFTTGDETRFRAKLFISQGTFASRLATLSHLRYRVLTLDEAIRDLAHGHVQPDAVVITIDDGYASTLDLAAPLLRVHQMPAIVYLTTYHVRTQTPVFDLVVAYILWKSTRQQALLVWPPGGPEHMLDLQTTAARDKSNEVVVALGRACTSEDERVALSRALGQALAVDYDAVVATGAFRLLSPDEAKAIMDYGVSLGLHTHRHRFPPDDLATCARELADNRDFLREYIGARSSHFCYPSGVYDLSQWEVLAAEGIASATTCDTGLVRVGDSPYGLRRFLDGEMVSAIEFEAELSGFADGLRRLLRFGG